MVRIASVGLLALLLATIVVADEPVIYDNAYLRKLAPLPITGIARDCLREDRCDAEDRAFVEQFLAARRQPPRGYSDDVDEPAHTAQQPVRERLFIGSVNGVPIPCVYGSGQNSWCDHPPRVKPRHPERPAPVPRGAVPHWRFIEKPPVREHTPGLGNAYRRQDQSQ